MKRLLFPLIVVVLLAGCATPKPTPTIVPTPTPTTKYTFEQALQLVKVKVPASSYMTNDYLPQEPVNNPTAGDQTKIKIKVGMPWILNDEEAPFYNAIELGYYTEEGLDVTLEAGGPGKNHLQTLGGKAVDIAVVAGAIAVPMAVVSPTPIDVVVVGTFLKGMPYCYLTIDPALQGKKLTAQDLVGTTIAVQSLQSGGDTYTKVLLDKQGIPYDKVSFIEGGYTIDVLLVGKAKFYTAWVVNQPRLAEEKGYQWNAMMYRDVAGGYDEYSDVIVVRRETLQTPAGQDMVRRFLRATCRGTQFLLSDPDRSAEIAVKYGVDAQLTKEQALWRFRQQETLVRGNDTLGLMHMDSRRWDEVVATYVQYGQMQIQ